MFSRPPAFTFQKGELHAEGLPVAKLAAKFGTPLYVYSASAIKDRYRTLERAFHHVPHLICYSVKANSNLTILRTLAGMGAGFDIVSGGELERVRRANKKALAKVVFSGVGKTADELRLALKSEVLLFNIESEGELELLAEVAAELRRKARIAFRINPDVPADTHPYISTGLREHKFGVPITEARRLYRQAAAHKDLSIVGVSLHIGSQIGDVSPFRLAMERAVELTEQLTSDGHKIRFIDGGGGLGISYNSTAPVDFHEQAHRYAEAITGPLQKLKKVKPRLLLEPGRSIVAPAGILVTRVLYQKMNGAKRFTIVDAAMNDLIRPSLYGARHEIVPVLDPIGKKDFQKADIAGPICETGDFLARDAMLPLSRPGEHLCVLDAGAYGMSLSSNYNTRTRAAEVMVEGKNARLVRRRETFKDLLQPETSCL